MTTPNEYTSGKGEAKAALAESRLASRRADTLISEARVTLDAVRVSRENNHFADKFRVIIQGGHRV